MTNDADGIVRPPSDSIPRQTFTRHELSTIVKVLVTVAVLAMVTVMAMVPSFGPGGGWHPGDDGDAIDDTSSQVQFSEPRIEAHRYEGSYRWTAECTVESVVLNEDLPRWQSGNVRIRLSARNEYPPPVPLVIGPPIDLGSLTPYYIELKGDPLGPDVGDIIGLSGLTRIHQRAEAYISAMGFGTTIGLGFWNETLKVHVTSPTVTVQSRGIDRWNISMQVTSVEPGWERAPWDWLRVRSDRSDPMDWMAIGPLPQNGSIDQGVFFLDDGTHDGLIGPGDEIRVVSIPWHWRDSSLEFKMGSASMISADIPEFYPSTTASIEFGEPVLTSRTSRWGPVCDLEVPITRVDPPDDPIAWDRAYIMVGEGLVVETFGCVPDVDLYDDGLHAWYHEAVLPAKVISVGDTLIVSGLTRGEVYEKIRILLREQEMGALRLPAIMPGMNCTFWTEWKLRPDRLDPSQDLWEQYVVIHGPYPAAVDLRWSEVEVTVFDFARSRVLMPAIVPSDHADPNVSIASAWYLEKEPAEGAVSEGDLLFLRGIDSSFEKGLVNLSWNGTGLGGGALPPEFTPTDLTKVMLALREPMINVCNTDHGLSYKLTIPMMSIYPSDATLPWSVASIRIYDGNGTLHPVNDFNLTPYQGFGSWDSFFSDQFWAWHSEYRQDDPVIGVHDSIGVTGLTAEFNSGRVEIWIGGHVAASAVIPSTIYA